MSTVVEYYKPRFHKYSQFPMLYAFRSVADEVGGISLAQGSPSKGPPPHVILRMAMRIC